VEFYFVLDACATPQNAKCEKYFTKDDDALSKDWYPYKRIWMNPPYDSRTARGRLMRWVGKAHGEAKKQSTVVCLLPASTNTKWWHEYAKDGEQRFIKGRLEFINDDGSTGSAPFGSVVVIFSTWRILVQRALAQLNSVASPKEIYKVLKGMLGRFNKTNNHIQAKVRQTLQRYSEFRSVERGEGGDV